jgi:nucleoid DNA-binding protein
MKINGEKLSLHSVIMRALVEKENLDIKNGGKFRITEDYMKKDKKFVARVTVNWLRHNDPEFDYEERMRAAWSPEEKNQIRAEVEDQIFKDYPQLKRWYDRNEWYEKNKGYHPYKK